MKKKKNINKANYHEKKKKEVARTSLAVRWGSLHGTWSSIPGGGTKMPHTTGYSPGKKKKKSQVSIPCRNTHTHTHTQHPDIGFNDYSPLLKRLWCFVHITHGAWLLSCAQQCLQQTLGQLRLYCQRPAQLGDLGSKESIELGGRRMVQRASCVWYTEDQRKRKTPSFHPLSLLLISCRLPFPSLGIHPGRSWKRHGLFVIYDISQREKAANTSKACTIIYTTVISCIIKKNPCIHILTIFTFKDRIYPSARNS